MAKILIVDDSRTSRNILTNILENAGHEVIGVAANGEEGYLKYKELKPDVVTMDITMPVMDGLEALRLIKRDEDAKVVMITAAGQKEKMIDALKHGATEFITKPFEDTEVIKVINNIVAE
ncbi:MAG: response regulator [Lachnospiraceae bacterium]|nr:response regulator [Lachnospiraceae bacterium]